MDPSTNEPKARRAAWCVLAAITAWQVVVAAMVQIEYYDGYEEVFIPPRAPPPRPVQRMESSRQRRMHSSRG